MVKYYKNEMVFDCVRGKDIIVFDTNTNVLLDISSVGRRIKVEFPEVVKLLRIKALTNQLHVGQSLVVKIRGYTVVALITQAGLFSEDPPETVSMMTINAINDMLSKVDKDLHFVSGILNRKLGDWARVAYHISTKRLSWDIYTE